MVPVYGPEHYLDACLAALAANTPEHELVLVDNATCHPFPLEATVVRNAVNLGFATACNQGATVAQHDVVVFLNVDTEVQPGWLPPLTTALERMGVGMAGSKLIYPDGRIQHAGIAFDSPTRARNIKDDNPSGFAGGVTGACMAIRKEVFFEAGGFDEGYWNGNEDVDLCLSVRKLGYQIWYERDSVVIHHESATGTERWSRVQHNVSRLSEKWSECHTP